jgi:hypothetical protein
MDLSKLPKLSNTSSEQPPSSAPPPEANQPNQGNQANPVLDYGRTDRALPGAAEAWISIVIGTILLFIFPNTIRYIHSPSAFEQNNPVTDANGNSLPYPKSDFFWADLGVTVFAAVLIGEGIVLAIAKKRLVVLVIMAFTASAAIFNLIVVAMVYNDIGFQITCALAGAIGGYMAMTQWQMAEALRKRG